MAARPGIGKSGKVNVSHDTLAPRDFRLLPTWHASVAVLVPNGHLFLSCCLGWDMAPHLPQDRLCSDPVCGSNGVPSLEYSS
jgi:hypothetical protein